MTIPISTPGLGLYGTTSDGVSAKRGTRASDSCRRTARLRAARRKALNRKDKGMPWPEIVARLDGPLHFRFIFQPLMASILAIIDGIKDARTGKRPYFWALLVTPGHRMELIKEGWKSIFKVSILAMTLEVAYQLITRQLAFRGYMFIAAFVLAILPYLLLRGPTNRIVSLLSRATPLSPASTEERKTP
jgi:hypothetical protein